MKDSKKQGASLSPERQLIQKMAGLKLKQRIKRKSRLSRLNRRWKRIINAPHNTNSFLIGLVQNSLGFEIETMDENDIPTGTMIGFNHYDLKDRIDDGDGNYDKTFINTNDDDKLFASLLL